MKASEALSKSNWVRHSTELKAIIELITMNANLGNTSYSTTKPIIESVEKTLQEKGYSIIKDSVLVSKSANKPSQNTIKTTIYWSSPNDK